MIRPGRAVWIVTRHFLCGRSMTILRDAGLLEFFIRILADLQVLMQQLAVFGIVCVPAAVPRAVDAETQADRIDFLTHYAASSLASTSRTTMVRCENGFSIGEARPRPRAWKRFITMVLADIGLGDDQLVDIEIVVVLSVRDGRFKRSFLTVEAMRLREN
jgi:hypothetical protein